MSDITVVSASTVFKRPGTIYPNVRNVFFAYEPEGSDDHESHAISRFSLLQPWIDRRNAKIYKILIHLFVDCEISIWADSDVRLPAPPEELVEQYLRDSDIALMQIPNCSTMKEHVKLIVRCRKDDPELVRAQYGRYVEEGCPQAQFAGGLILRRHTPEIACLNLAWWEQICHGSSRDQISLPYVLWKIGVEPAIIPGNIYSLRRR